MNDALTYNAFGLVTIQKNKVFATLTMVKNGRSFSRTVTDEDVLIKEVGSSESVAVTLGVTIKKDKTQVTAHEIGTQGQEGLMVEIPQVSHCINKVIDLVKIAAGI